MIAVLLISAVTVTALILCVLFVPPLKIGRYTADSYILTVLAGAVAMILSGKVNIRELGKVMLSDSAVNPLKILILFLSMTLLSIFLDEEGFFSYLAGKTLKMAGHSQKKLFLYLYLTVSVLTVFTSNDIIILTFTPFICYFAKNAHINPIPYLFAEFIAANTWSMALIIGNPTNIYLATAAGIDFVGYLKVMFLPTLFAGMTAFVLLYLLFRKELGNPIEVSDTLREGIKDKTYLTLGLVLLGGCTLIMAVGSLLKVEMWLVSLTSACLLVLGVLLIALRRHQKPQALDSCLKRAPWEIIPFVLSMFVLVLALEQSGVTAVFGNLLGEKDPVWHYGISSFLSANIVNNIPMSVFFSSVLDHFGGDAIAAKQAVFATVIGSNVGAFLTPIGALAGIMWSGLLKKQGVPFGRTSFVKYGVAISLPTLAIALGGLSLVLL